MSAALKSNDTFEIVAPVPAESPPLPPRALVAPHWRYTDAHGAVVFYVARFDKPGGKDIVPFTLQRGPDGTLAWRAKAMQAPRPLYRLHHLDAMPDAPVIVTEGEKAADAAAAMFPSYTATTSSGGSNGAGKTDWTPLRDRDVVVWPDNDEPGAQYAHEVGRLLLAAGAARVRVVVVPSEWPRGWDLADPVVADVTPDGLEAMLTDARDVERADEDGGAAGQSDLGGHNTDDDAEFERLAALSPIAYDRERKDAAERLGIRAPTLDAAVQRLRPAASTPGQGADLGFDDVEPHPETVDGAKLLRDIAAMFERYAALPPHASIALALWCMHAWAFEVGFTSPRLAITSPQPRCGKTTVLRLVAALVPRPQPTANATVSVLFRIVERYRPTLLIDEADSFLSGKDELRGLLNSGFQRDGTFLRNVGDDHEPRAFSTFCPVAIAAIGKLPATLEDRSIKVPMRRAVRGEVHERFRPDRLPASMPLLRAMAARWVNDNAGCLRESDPAMPDALHDRARDCWRPLIAIADIAGDDWPGHARAAALALSGDGDTESLGVDLLKDIKSAFEALGVDRISSAELVAKLIEDADRPWATIEHGRPLTQNKLARRLRLFDVTSKTVRLPDGSTPKGYVLADFEDAFARYLAAESATTPQPSKTNDNPQIQSATRAKPVAVQIRAKDSENLACGGVAVQKPVGAAAANKIEVEL